MAETTLDAKTRYFDELTLQLNAAGFTAPRLSPLNELMVEWQGQPLCKVNGAGNILYRSEDMRLPEIEAAKNQVIHIASTTAEYMRLMEAAPPLKASGLSGDYRTLADFNEVVLAGHPTQYGVEFITWDWDFDRKGVSHGHYYGSYGAAKQDFAVRSGFVRKDTIFTQEQLTDLYDAIGFMREHDEGLPYDHDQRLDKLQGQIGILVPDMADRLEQRQSPQGQEMGGIS